MVQDNFDLCQCDYTEKCVGTEMFPLLFVCLFLEHLLTSFNLSFRGRCRYEGVRLGGCKSTFCSCTTYDSCCYFATLGFTPALFQPLFKNLGGKRRKIIKMSVRSTF